MEQKPPVQFSNADTAAKYEATTGYDHIVHVPAGKEKGTGYKGLLSDITPEAAQRLIDKKGNQIRLKANVTKAVVTNTNTSNAGK